MSLTKFKMEESGGLVLFTVVGKSFDRLQIGKKMDGDVNRIVPHVGSSIAFSRA